MADKVTKVSRRELLAALEVVPEELRSYSRGRPLSDIAQMRKVFVEGDHWNNSSGWRGPLPEGTPQEVIDEIAKYFTSVNKIGEVGDRHLDAVIGLDPKWSWTVRRVLEVKEVPAPSPEAGTSKEIEKITKEEKKKLDRLNAIHTEWVDRHQVFWRIRQKADSFLWNASLLLRVFIPQSRLSKEGKLKIVPLEQSMDRLRVMVVPQENGHILYDEADEPVGSVYRFTSLAGKSETQIEYSWLDDENRTHIFSYNDKTNEWEHIDLDLGGRLIMFELRSEKPFVTQSMVQLNAQMDVALTMAGRNVIQGGFLERVLMNADVSGHFETVDDPVLGQRQVFVPDPIVNGPGTMLVISGEPVVNEDGERTGQRMTPQMQWKEPGSPSVFDQSAKMFETQIYSEARQLHANILGDATSSGVSRQQALQDFAMSINPTTRQFVLASVWIFETSLLLASGYSTEPEMGNLKDLKMHVQCRLGTKFLTSEDQNVIMSKVEKKLLSRESGMLEMGIEDPDAEKALIRSEAAEEPQPEGAPKGPGVPTAPKVDKLGGSKIIPAKKFPGVK